MNTTTTFAKLIATNPQEDAHDFENAMGKHLGLESWQMTRIREEVQELILSTTAKYMEAMDEAQKEMGLLQPDAETETREEFMAECRELAASFTPRALQDFDFNAFDFDWGLGAAEASERGDNKHFEAKRAIHTAVVEHLVRWEPAN
ncbi:hypothetical protein [Corynebacterium striatum]|uniref:hypothetical protein n=1 Tax=Corynebacterium striatum TaxID=43770 RepID=UPI00254B144D|nr:hypothetical protein [Corynebacterium striatum]MDK8809163.1 hypothetical protein [Corynebacterium striatum]